MTDRAQTTGNMGPFFGALTITVVIGLMVFGAVQTAVSNAEFEQAAETTTTPITAGLLEMFLVVVGLIVSLTIARHAAGVKRYPITTIGHVQDVSRRRVSAIDSCIECGATGTEGVSTVLREQSVLAGVPIRTHYAASHETCTGCIIDNEPDSAHHDLGYPEDRVEKHAGGEA